MNTENETVDTPTSDEPKVVPWIQAFGILAVVAITFGYLRFGDGNVPVPILAAIVAMVLAIGISPFKFLK